MEAYYLDGDTTAEYTEPGDKQKDHRSNITHLLLIAKDTDGYNSLVQLNNASHDPSRFYYVPRIDIRLLNTYSKGVIATTSCASGPIGQALMKHKDPLLALNRVKKLKEVFGKDLYAEIQPTDYKFQEPINKLTIEIARRLDILPIVTCDVHYPTADMQKYRSAIWAIDRKKTFKEIEGMDMPKTLYLQTEKEIIQGFKNRQHDIPNRVIDEGLANTYYVLDSVDEYSLRSRPKLPDIVGIDDTKEHMRQTCIGRMHLKHVLNKQYYDRFLYEFQLITKKGFTNYFLIVADFVSWARKQGIMVGAGRGSAAGSLVAYLLGITLVDPIEHGLLFERFMNEDREDLPDIDIDIQHDRREEVVSYFKQKYGGNVHGVSAFHSFGIKGAINDIIKIMEYPDAAPSKKDDEKPINTIEEAWDNYEIASLLTKYPDLEEYTIALNNQLRHISRHAGGFVYGGPGKTLPLMNVKGELISSYVEGVDFRNLGDFGFVKFDILGVTALSVIDSVRKLTGQKLTTIPLDDKQVLKEFACGNTQTIFQFNRYSAMKYLRDLRPSRFEDLVAANALLRPGAKDVGMDRTYIDRKNNPVLTDKSWATHPIIEEVLDTTYGVIVYQEQMTQLASKLGALTLSDAETLRREIIKYGKSDMHVHELDDIKERLYLGMALNGITEEQGDKIWENFLAFSRYGFTRNHSFPYTLLAYWQMWFRVNYPLEYFYSYVKFEDNEKLVDSAMKDAGKFNINFMLPDINLSEKTFKLEKDAIRFGFTQIKNVGDKASEEIIRIRTEGGLFKDMDDFVKRVPRRTVNVRVVAALKEEGAFNSIAQWYKEILV